MDAYSSLLNLNFMASLRTGNVVADMLIAMLIPVVSGIITNFFREWWPAFIEKLFSSLKGRNVETFVPATRESRGDWQVDLDENSLLQNILMHFVATTIKPNYRYGSYQYKRLLTTAGALSERKDTTFIDTLRSLYVTQTVPAKEHEVELNSNVSLTVVENADDADKQEGGSKVSEGGDGDKKNKLKQKTTTLVFRTRQSYFSSEDAMSTLANDALEQFKLEQKQTANMERYLYQPLMSAPAAGKEQGEAPQCQRYQLSHEKTFGTLFFPEKEKLIRLIHQFENKTGKFAVPGFPRKLILLLYGPPGTGKTSLVKAIAEHTKRHIFSIPLSRVQTNRQLLDYMFDTAFKVKNAAKRSGWDDRAERLQPDKVVYMLEDVDAASDIVKRKDAVMTVPPTAAASEKAKTHESVKGKKNDDSTAEVDTDTQKNGGDADSLDETKASAARSDAESNRTEEKAETPARTAKQEAKKVILIKEDDNSSCTSEDKEATEEEAAACGTSAAASEHAQDVKDADVPASNSNNISTKEMKAKQKTTATVDRVTISQEAGGLAASGKDKLSIKGLLEAFGGILDAPGRIVIMTTNHIEDLDPALLRPGVVTMKLHMGNFDAKCGVEMVRHYFASQYRCKGDGESWAAEDAAVRDESGDAKQEGNQKRQKPFWDESLLAEVAAVIEKAKTSRNGFSPAEVEQLCAENETIEDLLVALKRGSRREIF